MSSKLPAVIASLWLATIFMLAAPPALPSAPTVFMDYDGDGFDDNAPDDDADGIPDEVERHSFISAPAAELQVSQMFGSSAPVSTAPAASTGRGDAFGRRKFATRAVCENRTDFDDGFGSGLGIGGGMGAGGGCAGGVCF